MKREQLVSVFIALVGLSPLAAQANTIERVGYAYAASAEGDKLLYTEQHREQVEDGRITRSTVTYEDAEGNTIAVKNLDFSVNPTSPEFRLEGVNNGHVEGAQRKGGDFVVFFRESDGAKYVEEQVPLPNQAIIDGGFDRFIEDNWESLLGGKVFKRPFLVPSFQKFLDFKIYLDRSTDTEAVFVMETASFLLRIVSEKIIVTYNRDNAALRRYEGISNIRDLAGDNYDVRVEFPGADARSTAAGE